MKTIIILLFAFTASAQSSLQHQIESVVLNERKTLIESYEADEFANYLLRFVNHHELFDTAFNSYNSSWCDGIDVYVYDQPQEILQAIRFNEMNFKLPEVSRVAVVVKKVGDDYLVLITSYDQ